MATRQKEKNIHHHSYRIAITLFGTLLESATAKARKSKIHYMSYCIYLKQYVYLLNMFTTEGIAFLGDEISLHRILNLHSDGKLSHG